MLMTRLDLVALSWQQILPITERSSALFYAQLFSLNPALKQQFLAVSPLQQSQMITLLGQSLSSAASIENIVATMQELMRRYSDYSLSEHDFTAVATALMSMLAQGLGSAFSPALRRAWQERTVLLSAAMKQELSEEVTYGFTD
jgi:hemoglobin-like flavoprotein